MTALQPDLILALRRALTDGRIVPHFQPIVSLRDRKIVGFEVLARWPDAELGDISPAVFIPLIEQDEKLDELLDGLMAQALGAALAWPKELFLAFNISPKQLHGSTVPARIAAAAEAAGFSLGRIHVEVTETAIIEDEDHARATLQQLIAMGCTIAMDDFGTGYSSLTWLRNLPISKIKIDTVFVRSMLRQKESRKIVNAVVGLGHSLGLSIVAEGVETVEQAEMLRSIGCGYAQGFLFSKAVPAAEVPALLRKLRHKKFRGRQAQLSLEQRAYQISALYRWDDIAIGFLDVDHVIIDASKSFAALFGRTQEEAIGMRLLDLDPQNPRLVEGLIGGQPADGGRKVLEISLPSGRTDLFVVEDVRDEAGELMGRSVLGIDITKRKKTEAELRDQQKRLRFVTDNGPNMFWAMAPEGRLLYVSPAWEALSGMTFDEIVNGEVGKYLHLRHRTVVLDKWASCLKTGDVLDMDYLHLLADGAYHWVRCWGAPFRNEEGLILGWFGSLNVLHPPRPPDGGAPEGGGWAAAESAPVA